MRWADDVLLKALGIKLFISTTGDLVRVLREIFWYKNLGGEAAIRPSSEGNVETVKLCQEGKEHHMATSALNKLVIMMTVAPCIFQPQLCARDLLPANDQGARVR